MSVVYNDDVDFSNTKILFAIVDQDNISKKHPELFKKMYEITYSYTKRISNIITSDVVFFDNIDIALEECEENYDLMLIQSVGNFIKSNEILKYINDYYKTNPEFFMMAFTLDWEPEKGAGWVECHNQMILINPRVWRSIGCPEYGGWETVTEELPNYIRSEENFHDKYTPYWMQGTTGTSLKTRAHQGWGLIKRAFEYGFKIDNFSNNIRNCRLYVYPGTDSENLWQAFLTKDHSLVTNPNQKKWIKSLTLSPQIWIYNSERYHFSDVNFSNCDTYFGPAAGFKYLAILKHCDNPKFVFYDFQQSSLDWIRTLKETWDGNNFVHYLDIADEKYKAQYKYVNTDLATNQKQLFDDFGGEEEFKRLWNKFKNCDAEFITCDLFDQTQVDNLLSLCTGSRPFFYYSNIFATDYTIINHTLWDIENRHNLMLSHIFQRFPQAITHGSDPVGTWITKTS